MSIKLFFKANDEFALSKAIKHLRTCNYHVETSTGNVFSVMIPKAHGAPVEYLIRDYGLQNITEEEFQHPELVGQRRAQALSRVHESQKRLEERMVQEKKACICGYSEPDIPSHKMHCKRWKQYVEDHTEEIIKDAVEHNRGYATKKWHVGFDTITVVMFEKGLLKFEELSTGLKTRYANRLSYVKPRQELTPEKPVATDAPGTEVIPEAITAIWRLQKENTVLRGKIAEIRKILEAK